MPPVQEDDIGVELLYGSSEYSLEKLPDNESIQLSEGVRRIYLDLLSRSEEDQVAFDVASLLCAAGEEAGMYYFIKFAKASRAPDAEPISPHRLTEEEMAYDDCSSSAIRFLDAGGDIRLAHELLRTLLQRFLDTNFEMRLPTLLEVYGFAEGVKDDILSAVLRAKAVHRPSKVVGLVGALGRFYPEEALPIIEWLVESFRKGAPRLLEEEIGDRLAMIRTQQGRLLAESFAGQPDIRKIGETALMELRKEFEFEESRWQGRLSKNDRWSKFSWRHPSVPEELIELLDRSAQGDNTSLLKALERLRSLEPQSKLWAQHIYMPHDRAHGFLAEAAFLQQRHSGDPGVYLTVCRALLKTVGARQCSVQLGCALLDGPSEPLAELIEERLVRGLDDGQKDNVAPLYPALAKLRPKRAWELLERLRDPENRPLNPEVQLAQGLAVMGGDKAVALLRAMVSHESPSVMTEAEMALEDLGETVGQDGQP